MQGYMVRLALRHEATFGMLLRAVMPTQVTVEHPPQRKTYESYEDVTKELAELGIDIPEILALEYTADDVLELDAQDVPDSNTTTDGG
jgi:hypothetical protein